MNIFMLAVIPTRNVINDELNNRATFIASLHSRFSYQMVYSNLSIRKKCACIFIWWKKEKKNN